MSWIELRIGQALRLERDRLESTLDGRELQLHACHRLAEEPKAFEQPDDVGTDACRRPEVDDLDRDAAADAIQSPDALLHRRGFPRQVVEHEPMTELKVAPFAAGFGRHEDAWPLVGAEQRHLGVTPRRRQLLVEDPARELRPRAERLAQHLERLAMGHEHERLLVRPPPALRLGQQPLEARIGVIHRLRLLPQLDLVRPQHRLQRRAGGQRPSHAIERAPSGNGIERIVRVREAGRGSARREGGRRKIDRHRRPRRQAPDIHSARRAGARRERDAGREPRRDIHALGKLLRPQQLQQPEEPMRVVFERRRAEEQDVPPERGHGSNRAILPPTRMSRRTPETLRLVNDEQVDARRDRLSGQLWPVNQRLERNHGAAMGVERVEAGAEVPRDVGQARRVEEREHLVILAPQLAQPLDCQRLGRDDQAALDLLRVQQPVHDERRFDGLAEPHLVGEEPPHRDPRGRAFRDVQLMRE